MLLQVSPSSPKCVFTQNVFAASLEQTAIGRAIAAFDLDILCLMPLDRAIHVARRRIRDAKMLAE
jgi:hypothetical protein